jgi:hypothetical protein
VRVEGGAREVRRSRAYLPVEEAMNGPPHAGVLATADEAPLVHKVQVKPFPQLPHLRHILVRVRVRQ